MGNSEGWDYQPDLGSKSKVTEEDVDDVIERDDDEEPDFGFEMDAADEDEDIEPSEPLEKPAKKPVDKGTVDGANAPDSNQVAEAVLKHVGGDTLVRIKGVEKPLKDFSPQEIVNWIQKSARADQVFQEAAASRRQVEEERRRLEEERARLSQEAGQGRGREGSAEPRKGTIPDFLKPGQFDTEEVTALKQFAAEQQQRLERLEGNFSQNQQKDKLRDIQHEVDELAKEYPMASRDEVLAVKLSHPEAPTEELMRLAHNWYSSKDHIDAAFKSNPTYKREYDEAVIKQYIARKQSAKKIAGQPVAAGSSSSKVAEKGKKPIRTFDDATKASHSYLREMRRVSEED